MIPDWIYLEVEKPLHPCRVSVNSPRELSQALSELSFGSTVPLDEAFMSQGCSDKRSPTGRLQTADTHYLVVQGGAVRVSVSPSRIQASMARHPGCCSASSGVTQSLRPSSLVKPSLPSRGGVPSVLVSWLIIRTPVILDEQPVLSSGGTSCCCC